MSLINNIKKSFRIIFGPKKINPKTELSDIINEIDNIEYKKNNKIISKSKQEDFQLNPDSTIEDIIYNANMYVK